MGGAATVKVGVLGGGLAGLAVAANSRSDCEVLEADSHTGGHCRSLVRDGYTFDLGGPHIMFSRDRGILGYMIELLAGNVAEKRRHNVVYYDGRYVKYPFENGLHDLKPEDRFECLNSYLNNDHPSPTNFREWLYHTFGTGIAEKYLIPYNEKIWNIPATQMAFDWVEGRVPRPPAEDVIKSAVGVETEGYTHQLDFSYPVTGGIEALPGALARKCGSITRNFRVNRLWREEGTWRVSNGHDVKCFDRIVSTIPVHELVHALNDVPDDILRRAGDLRFNSLITVMLGFETDNPPPYTAIYVPGDSFMFHRLSFPLNFTDFGAPEGCAAISAEITTLPDDRVYRLGDDEIIERVIDGLSRMNLIDPERVNFRHVCHTRYAYVLRTFDYRENLDVVLDYLDGRGITSVGRNAEFEYLNMDQAIGHALDVAERLDREG